MWLGCTGTCFCLYQSQCATNWKMLACMNKAVAHCPSVLRAGKGVWHQHAGCLAAYALPIQMLLWCGLISRHLTGGWPGSLFQGCVKQLQELRGCLGLCGLDRLYQGRLDGQPELLQTPSAGSEHGGKASPLAAACGLQWGPGRHMDGQAGAGHTLKRFSSSSQLAALRSLLTTCSKECISNSTGWYLLQISATKKPLAKSLPGHTV